MSHLTQGVVHLQALLHRPHGYFRRGPGLDSTSPQSSKSNVKDVHTSRLEVVQVGKYLLLIVDALKYVIADTDEVGPVI